MVNVSRRGLVGLGLIALLVVGAIGFTSSTAMAGPLQAADGPPADKFGATQGIPGPPSSEDKDGLGKAAYSTKVGDVVVNTDDAAHIAALNYYAITQKPCTVIYLKIGRKVHSVTPAP